MSFKRFTPNSESKIPTSVSLTVSMRNILEDLAVINNRTRTNIMEELILDSAKANGLIPKNSQGLVTGYERQRV